VNSGAERIEKWGDYVQKSNFCPHREISLLKLIMKVFNSFAYLIPYVI